MALAIDITDGRGLSNEVRRELLLKKSEVLRLHCDYNQCSTAELSCSAFCSPFT